MEYRVRELQVEAQYKQWGPQRGGMGATGGSGGTIFRWMVVPPEGVEAWTQGEALEVTLESRRDLQALLLCDAEARGCSQMPDNGLEAIGEYGKALESRRVFEAESEAESEAGWERVPARVVERGVGTGAGGGA